MTVKENTETMREGFLLIGEAHRWYLNHGEEMTEDERKAYKDVWDAVEALGEKLGPFLIMIESNRRKK